MSKKLGSKSDIIMFLYIYTDDENLINPYQKSAEEYNCDNNAGFDLFLPKNVLIKPRVLHKVDLRVYACLTDGESFYRYYLYPRSSMPNRGVILGNSVGLVDSSYRNYPKDSLSIQLLNYTDDAVEIKSLSRLVQIDTGLLFKPVVRVLNFGEWMVYCQVKTARGGFGSTGD